MSKNVVFWDEGTSKKVFFSIVMCFCSAVVPAQTISTEFYNRFGDRVSADKSYYFSTGMKNASGFFFDSLKSFYSKTKQVRSIEIRDHFGTPRGDYELFYPNKTLHLKGRYEKKHFKLFQTSADSAELSIEQFNDSSGEVQVKNYNGHIRGQIDGWVTTGKIVNGLRDSVWTLRYDNGKTYCHESWHEGELVDGISYDSAGKEYYYKAFFSPPEPSEGVNNFYDRMSDEIDYPKDAQRRGVIGTVDVAFTIGKNGVLSSPHIIKGIGFGCDEEALRVLSRSQAWKPALKRGQPVAHEVSIPFVFRLK